MSERDNFGTFLVGFLVGGLTGAVVALLYAPQSGDKTRAVIKEKAIELVDTLEDTTKKIEPAATDAFAKIQTEIKKVTTKKTDVSDKGNVVLEEVKEKPKKS